MLDVSSSTVWLLRPERGQADDPQRAGDRAGEAARARRSPRSRRALSESSTRKNRSVYPIVTTSPPSSAPPSPAMKPPSANAVSLARVGETVSAAARRLVLAHADDRAADAGAAQVADEQRARSRGTPSTK